MHVSKLDHKINANVSKLKIHFRQILDNENCRQGIHHQLCAPFQRGINSIFFFLLIDTIFSFSAREERSIVWSLNKNLFFLVFFVFFSRWKIKKFFLRYVFISFFFSEENSFLFYFGRIVCFFVANKLRIIYLFEIFLLPTKVKTTNNVREFENPTKLLYQKMTPSKCKYDILLFFSCRAVFLSLQNGASEREVMAANAMRRLPMWRRTARHTHTNATTLHPISRFADFCFNPMRQRWSERATAGPAIGATLEDVSPASLSTFAPNTFLTLHLSRSQCLPPHREKSESRVWQRERRYSQHSTLALFGCSMRSLSPLNAIAVFTRARKYQNNSWETLNALSFPQNPFISLLWLLTHVLVIDIQPTRNAFDSIQVFGTRSIRKRSTVRWACDAFPNNLKYRKSDNGSCISLWDVNTFVILAT